MPVKVQIDGVGTVELDDGFQSLSPDQQQATIDEIASTARQQSAAAPKEPEATTASSGGTPAPKGPRGNTPTYQALERFISSKYPSAKFTSDYRDPEHNRAVGGVEGSYHTTRQAVDMTGLSDSQRTQLKQDLIAAGVNPREFLYHNAGSGMHLHVAADSLPPEFLSQWGPQAAPAPEGATTPQVPAAQQQRSPERQAEIDNAIAQATGLIQAGKEREAVDLLGQHRLTVSQEELEAFRQGKRSAGFNLRNAQPAAPDERSWGDTGVEALKSLGEGVVGGVGGLVDMASEGITGAFQLPTALGGNPDNAWNPGAREALTNLYEGIVGTPESTTDGERYLNAAARMTGEFAVPLSSLKKADLARRALSTVIGGSASGAGGEAAADAAPILGADPDTARTVGQVIGGVVGGSFPVAGKAVSAARDARFVGKQVKDPRAPFLAEVVQDLSRVAKEHAPNGVVPKGRGPVTVQQIGDLERSYLVGVKAKIGKLDIPEVQKQRLREAIERKYTISQDELQALKGTTEGDAVALGIQKVQALRDLTPPYNGSKPGIMGTVAEAATNVGLTAATGNPLLALGGTLARKALRGLPGDVNASRLDAARKALKRQKAYEKVGARVGPSGQREAMDKLNSAYEQTVNSPVVKKAQARRSPEDLAVEHHISMGRTGSFGSTDFYASVLGVSRDDVIKAIDEINVPQGFEFEAAKLKNGFKVRKSAQDALIPELRAHLGPKASASAPKNASAQAAPTAERTAADASERIYRPVEDASRYSRGKERIVRSQTRGLDEVSQHHSQEIMSSAQADIEHMIATERTTESAMRHFREKVAPRLKQEGFMDGEIEDLARDLERQVVSKKRYQTDAQFKENVIRK